MLVMPNISSILKSEIARVARKQLRAETMALKKAVSSFRTEIAALKRRTRATELELSRLTKASRKALPVESPVESEVKDRIGAKTVASQRRRLGLSVSDFGLLVGASGQSVYNWEYGNAKPRAKHRLALASIKAMGKKQAAARLISLRETS
jgi:DNA-binding transcriptional regulator YiaG